MQHSAATPALRSLLPASDRPPQPPPPTKPLARTAQSPVACERCRIKKTKCNREQPVCARCRALELECEYAVGFSDRSRKAALQRRLGEVENERDSLRDLLNFIQTQPDAEADEIFRRLRANRDPILILQSIRQARLLLPNPSPIAHFEGNPQVELLDAQGSRWSSLKLRARPWTTVAGDGIVSALISSFFAWDGIYVLPFIDRVCFVRDMNSRDVAQSHFCSPFLVNAICMLQHYSDAIRQINAATGQTMQELFFLEASQHYNLENGRASLPTVQGLLIMFMASCFLNHDDAAPVYRSLGYDMLDRLRIDEKIASCQDEDDKRAYSMAAWGVYCCENTVANFNNTRPERPEPTVPRLFSQTDTPADDASDNVDIFGEPFTVASYRPPFTPGLLNAACDLALVQHGVINYNLDVHELGIEDSFETRQQQYRDLQVRRDALSPHLRNECNPTPGTGFLSIHSDIVALFLLRPLSPKLLFYGHATTQDLRIMHSQRIISLIERHFRTEISESSVFYLSSLFHVCLTLVPSLSTPLSDELFTRAAAVLHRSVVDRQILRGIEAVVWGLKKCLPESARASFENLKSLQNKRKDNMEWGWPQREYAQSEPDMDYGDLDGIEGKLGRLISLWEAS